MWKFLLLPVLLLAGGVDAQTVIVKCADAAGRITYTTDTCPSNQTQEDRKTYPAVREDARAREESRRIDALMQSRYRADRGNSHPASSTTRSDSRRERQRKSCAAARQAADDARSKNYDRKRMLARDKAEVDACFGL